MAGASIHILVASHTHTDYRRRNSILSGVSIYPLPHLFIPQTRTPGLGRKEWPARLNISWVHIQSMTGSESTRRAWFQKRGPGTSQAHHRRRLEDASRYVPRASAKVAAARDARDGIPKLSQSVVPAHSRSTAREVCDQMAPDLMEISK